MQTILSLGAKRKKIFIVDRDIAFIEAISLHFKDRYDVYGFTTLEELKENLKIQPDVVLYDVIPYYRTREIVHSISKVKNFYRKVPILITSTSKKVFTHARKFGIREFIEKPFDIFLLQKKIRMLTNYH